MSVDIATTRRASDVLIRVKRTFGDEAGVQITNSDIFSWLNDGQIEIARQVKYDRRKISTDVKAGVGWFSLSRLNLLSIESIFYRGKPLDYVQLGEAEDVIYRSDPYYRYEKHDNLSPVELITKGQAKEPGAPRLWTIDFNPVDHAVRINPEDQPEISTPQLHGDPSIYVWPVPDADVDRGLLLTVVLAPARITDENDLLSVPDKYFNALIQYILMQAYELDEDHPAAQVKREEFVNSMMGQDAAEKEEQQRLYPMQAYFDEGW